MFEYRFIRYLYNFESGRFEPIRLDTKLPYTELRERYTQPKTQQERELARIKFGECVVNVPRQSAFGLFVHEVLNPFYIF